MRKAATLIFVFAAFTSLVTAQVDLGDKVPNFDAINQDGEKWVMKHALKSSEYLVIYFYPAAFTGGCTAQACTYRDQKGELEKVNANVVGVSGDSPKTLELFALEHSLNFTLLADESGEIAELFGVPMKDGGTITREIKGTELELTRASTIQRWTFILDKKGNLIYKDSEVKASEDTGKVIEFLSSI
jgi:peroxiredoxin Q/BCP